MDSEQSRGIRGRCMCGDIRYEFTGPMLDTVHCHCESCRRNSDTSWSARCSPGSISAMTYRATPRGSVATPSAMVEPIGNSRGIFTTRIPIIGSLLRRLQISVRPQPLDQNPINH